MDLQLVDLGGDAFAFRHIQDDKMLAEITWTMLGDVMVADHTFVSPELRGQGAAKKLVDRAAQYARDNNLKIEPICTYIVSTFERSNEYDDIKV